MKRDMDLFRATLLEIEKQPATGNFFTVLIPGYAREEVCYHARLAQDAGFIEARFSPGSTSFMVERLTFAGHEFLDAAREETLWNEAKRNVLKSAGVLTVEALKISLSLLMRHAAHGAA